MKKICTLFFLTLCINVLQAQKYFTRTGKIDFDAGTGVEDIKGINKSVTSVIDASTGQIQFQLLVKGFEFRSQLMQDHFNENYMESDNFPKSTFKGTITNIDNINFSKDGIYSATVKGTLDIHGVKKEVESRGTIRVKGDVVDVASEFVVTMDDYKIAIPSLVKDKLSRTAKIKVNCSYTPMNQ